MFLGETTSIGSGEYTVFPTNIRVDPKPLYTVLTSIYNVLGAFLGLPTLTTHDRDRTCGQNDLVGTSILSRRSSRTGRTHLPHLQIPHYESRLEAKIGQRLVQQDEDHFTPIGRFLRKYRLDEQPQ